MELPMTYDNENRPPRPPRRPRADHDSAGKRPFRGDGADKSAGRRPPIRESLMEQDQELLKLLARRSNMLQRLRNDKGHLDPREEKEIRASWEKAASRMSRDTRLVHQLFALLQEIEFQPRLAPGEERRAAFTLAPALKPVDVRLAAPLACRRSRLYLTLAAVAGQVCRISPSLLGDPVVEFVKMFNQAGTSLAWEENGLVHARQGGGITLADKVIFVGDDALNFALILGQYVGQVSRAKFTGDANLKLADYAPLRNFLPQLGARFTNAVPKSNGLPVRIECSGVTPDTLSVPADVPADVITGLLMAAPFWERAVAFDLSRHPHSQDILGEAVVILQDCGADITVQDTLVRVTPGPLRIPAEPALSMDVNFAAPLLALPALADGQVRLTGRWPQCSLAQNIQKLLRQAGVEMTPVSDGISTARLASAGQAAEPLDASLLPERFAPLALALAVIPALRGRQARMPLLPAGTDQETVTSFLLSLRLDPDSQGTLQTLPPLDEAAPWTAPTPQWAVALALAAFAKPGLKLANPGIMTGLYPAFWNLYNALPCPDLKKIVTEPVHEKPVRRRIIAADQSGTGDGDSDN